MDTWFEITQLLRRSAAGDTASRDQLQESLDRNLRRVAEPILARRASDTTLQPAVLLNEMFAKLSAGANVEEQDRVHFLAFAARHMRRILVDHVRHRNTSLHDSDPTLTLVALGPEFGRAALDLLHLAGALGELERFDERTARVVDLRFFAGLTEEETAQALGVPPTTVHKDWRFAKGWLMDRLEGGRR